MACDKMIGPCIETPPPGRREQTSSTRLPETLVTEHVDRLALWAAVGGCLWTYGLVMDLFVRPYTIAARVMTSNVVIEMLAIVASASMFAYVRYAPYAASRKADVGLGYFVLNAIAVAFLNTWTHTVTLDAPVQLSWNAVVILVSAMIMPATPRKILVTSVIAASMDPLAMWLAHLRGLPVPSVVNTLVFFMPNYACAAVAAVPSRALHRLGRRLRQAQEMGSYHLVELLGRGGMGEVWRAQHRLLARTAAIKLVRPELLGASSDTEARAMLRRFEREAQATAALSSPHTIRVFDFGVTADNTFYYVMELLAGRDLESLVREFGPVPAERALFLLEQVCHSLADAHARGLVHRDVTPSNIYVCRMGLDYDFVKVLDFGLVTFNDRGSDAETVVAATHMTTGTPAFMAPEIVLGGDVDQRADVYALGCVEYYLLTGQHVFEADAPMQMFLQHVQAAPIPPSRRTELPIPAALDELILACLEKDPNRRPQDAAEVFARLRQIRTRDTWDNGTARTWWEHHLLELTGPLTVAEAGPLDAVAAAR